MLYIDFCKAPKGFWVGCIEYNNGRAFASGRTLDLLVSNMKAMAYHTWKASAYNVMLSSRQMEAGEFEAKHAQFMSSKFKGRFWNQKTEENKVKKDKNSTASKKIVVDGVLYDSISNAEKTLGIKPDTIGQALRHNKSMAVGHSIAYADSLPQFTKPKEKQKPQNEATGKYTYEEKDGILYVYEKKLVAKYEVENEK